MNNDDTIQAAASALDTAIDLCIQLSFDKSTFVSVAGKAFDQAIERKVRKQDDIGRALDAVLGQSDS